MKEQAFPAAELPVPFNGNTYLGCTQYDIQIPKELVEQKGSFYRQLIQEQPMKSVEADNEKEEKTIKAINSRAATSI